jgi:hypothetical protein
MNLRLRVAVLIVAVAALAVWKSQLFIVTRPGDHPRPLELIEVARRAPAHVDATLPAVPFGAVALKGGDGVLIVHYWAPWERHAATQAATLDSLIHSEERRPQLAVVCFDPFPSLARYVARQRLRIAVLLDHGRTLAASLPCPSIPYTYVIDRDSRIAVAQAGEVDWLSPDTRAVIRALIAEPATRPAGDSSRAKPVRLWGLPQAHRSRRC